MKKLAQYCESRDNNFNLIRFIAAFSVVVAHSTSIVHGENVIELLQLETGYPLGNLAVNVFFIVSGFLIAQSYVRSKDLFAYISARLMRLIPALVVATFVTAFIIGPLVTSVPLSEYYSSWDTWAYVPFVSSLVMESSRELPGVFETLPFAKELNTPLWTLRWEFMAYLGIAVLGLMGILKSKRNFGLVFAGFILVFVGLTQFSDLRTEYDAVDHMMRLGFSFLIGSAFYVYRAYISFSILMASVLWIAVYAVKDTALYQLMLIAALGYSTFWLAYIPGGIIRAYNKLGDVSYGVYIYGFILSQVLIFLMPELDTVLLVIISTPFIIGAAALSYYVIEQPAMEMRKSVAEAARSLFARRENSAGVEVGSLSNSHLDSN